MDYHYYDEEEDFPEDDDPEGEDAGDDEDFYMQDDEEEEYGGEMVRDYLWRPEGIRNSLEDCVLPSLLQVIGYVAPMVLLCLVCRLLCFCYAKRERLSGVGEKEAHTRRTAPLHGIHLICGLLLLHLATGGHRVVLIVFLSIVGYLLLQLTRSGGRGPGVLALLTIGSQFVYELCIWRQRTDWPQLRGIQMVVNMKLISLGFDQQRVPGPLAFFGYIYSPATCCLGPWISYAGYLEGLVPRTRWTVSLARMVPNLLLCLAAISLSNCIAPQLGELLGGRQWQWVLMYFDAMSVRSSHYFVSFIAQALLVAVDQRLEGPPTLLGPCVSRPWRIEWPRSISSLVRSWNIPMHEWLKRYIYGPAKGPAGGSSTSGRRILAAFCTYLVSSLLHGMDMRIYLVLISLALFGESESLLRRHVARLMDACVSAGRCPGADRCRYGRCPAKVPWTSATYWLVRLANFGFTALTIMHLAYLGVALLGESLEEGLVLAHWQATGYLSHYIGLATLVLYLFIS
ncbi:hypothetical protein KR018_002124 [Drosophila ironensis]|nr:hypothetical protein KR018_002124 [Drosophila ironensis]